MIHPIRSNKKRKNTKESKLPILVRRVKLFEIKNSSDCIQLEILSEAIFYEWSKLKNEYRYQLKRGSRVDKRLYATCEAQEEIVVGLLSLLNQRLIKFFKSRNK